MLICNNQQKTKRKYPEECRVGLGAIFATVIFADSKKLKTAEDK